MGRSQYCPFCYPETTVYYQDETIAIIQDKYRPGKLIITCEHVPMTKEALDEVFEIHAGTWHVSVDHMHIYYEPLRMPDAGEVEGRLELGLPSSIELADRYDVLQRSLKLLSRLWLQEALTREGGEETSLLVWSRWGQTLGRVLKADLPLRKRNVKAALTSLHRVAISLGWGTPVVGKMSSDQEGFLKLESCSRWRIKGHPKEPQIPCYRLDEAFCQGFVQEFNPQIEATLTRSLPEEGDYCQMVLRWKGEGRAS